MPLRTQPLVWHRTRLVEPRTGLASSDFIRYIQTLEEKTGPTLTLSGQLENTALISSVSPDFTIGDLARGPQRLTTAQRDALTPRNGDLIYNTTLDKFQGYEAGAWVNLI